MAKYFTEHQRYQLEGFLKNKMTIKEIAGLMGKSERTIKREIARGTVTLINSDLTERVVYDAWLAQQDYLEKSKKKGPTPKILEDDDLLETIRHMIVEDELSPDVVVNKLRKSQVFDYVPCTTSVYTYIDRGYIPGVTNKNLTVKRTQKQKRKRKLKKGYPKGKLTSIEDRPDHVNDREEFGHWEMDCVESCKGIAHCLLVLTERKTRFSFVYKMKAKTQECVKAVLDRLERLYRAKFKQLFKTITVDNGSEFLNQAFIETSIYSKRKKRTNAYYCHAYSAWERGSNENYNGFIRRWVKKGENIAILSKQFIQWVADKINNYPRRLLDYATSAELFNLEVAAL